MGDLFPAAGLAAAETAGRADEVPAPGVRPVSGPAAHPASTRTDKAAIAGTVIPGRSALILLLITTPSRHLRPKILRELFGAGPSADRSSGSAPGTAGCQRALAWRCSNSWVAFALPLPPGGNSVPKKPSTGPFRTNLHDLNNLIMTGVDPCSTRIHRRVGARETGKPAGVPGDGSILNFALNLGYLEAELPWCRDRQGSMAQGRRAFTGDGFFSGSGFQGWGSFTAARMAAVASVPRAAVRGAGMTDAG